MFCAYDPADRKNISDYSKALLDDHKPLYPDVVNQQIDVIGYGITLQPFKDWSQNKSAQSLEWWFDFDKIKHNRVGNVERANLFNTLNALSALYLLEMKELSRIVNEGAEGSGHPHESDVPDIESRLFQLKNWNYRWIPMGNGFAIIDGAVCQIFLQ